MTLGRCSTILAVASIGAVGLVGCGTKKSEAQRAKDAATVWFDHNKAGGFLVYTGPVSCIRTGSEDIFDCWRKGTVKNTTYRGIRHADVVCDAAGGPCVASKGSP